MRWAGFDLVGDHPVGVVLIHGFSSTPYEIRYLGESLARGGFSVHAPLLPGHGTAMEELDRTPWQAWAGAVDRAVDLMARRCARVALVGQSLGGLLSLYTASRRPEVAAVGSLAAPLWLDGLAGVVARWVVAGRLDWVRRIPKLGGSDVRDRAVRAENPCYPAIPTRALRELMAFMAVTRAALPAVTQPVLVLHGRKDHTAPVACATELAAATRAVRVRVLPRSYHLISADVERELVAAEVSAFLHRHASPGASA